LVVRQIRLDAVASMSSQGILRGDTDQLEMWAVLMMVLRLQSRMIQRQVEFQSDNKMVVVYLQDSGGWNR